MVDAAKGIVDVELTNQILNTPGVATCQVMIIGTENELLSSLKLIFAVEKSINYSSIESTNEYNALIDAMSDVQSIRNEFDIVIANATVDSEVILARGGNTTLKERLDNVDSQLADKVQNFKLKNEVLNGGFITTGAYTTVGGTLAFVNGRGVLTENLVSSEHYIQQALIMKHTPVKKYYAKLGYADKETALMNIFIPLTAGGYQTVVLNTANNRSAVYSASSNANASAISFFRLYGRSGIYVGTAAVYEFDNAMIVDLTNVFGAGNEPTKLEMDELMKVVPDGWWDGELTLTQKQFITWQLNLIRKNTNAIIALGGTIV